MLSRVRVSPVNHALNHASVISSSAEAYLESLYRSLCSHSVSSCSSSLSSPPFSSPILVRHTYTLSLFKPRSPAAHKNSFFLSPEDRAAAYGEFLHSCFSFCLTLSLSLCLLKSAVFFFPFFVFSCRFVFASHLWPSPSCYLTAPTCRARAPAALQGWAETLRNRSVRGKPGAQVD